MWAVGYWYQHFDQTTDADVASLLAEARTVGSVDPPAASGVPSAHVDPPGRSEEQIPIPGGGEIVGDLVVPERPSGIVVFAHGSGSSRHSPRNREVAAALNRVGFATLLIDLLTLGEERERANVFDIPLLASRLSIATRWVRTQPGVKTLGLGYFGASTGAGAALWAAAELGAEVQAVVSRGGRPDLAVTRLHKVRSPTLLIVGGLDHMVIDLNREALAQLRCEAALEIVPDATHLFEEPGTLEQVSRLAVMWFTRHLTHVASTAR
jgi:dienelactone hydrolase